MGGFCRRLVFAVASEADDAYVNDGFSGCLGCRTYAVCAVVRVRQWSSDRLGSSVLGGHAVNEVWGGDWERFGSVWEGFGTSWHFVLEPLGEFGNVSGAGWVSLGAFGGECALNLSHRLFESSNNYVHMCICK